MTSEEPVQKQKPELFKIHSLVREIATRNQRMKAASHHRFVQRFGGGTITVRRARPANVNKATLMKNIKEIKKAVEEGKIVVKTPTGEVVNLDTFETTPVAQNASPAATPPLDSAANDRTFEQGVGEKVPLFPDGGVPGGESPPLNVQPALMSDDKPITAGGDPARARAEQAAGGKKGSESNEESLGDDEPTVPDGVVPGGDTGEKSGGKKAKDKQGKKEGTK